MNITVYNMREGRSSSDKKSLTLAMIHNDGYGHNLDYDEYKPYSESVIRDKVNEFNGLSGESNCPQKLIKQYRRKTLGVIGAINLNILEKNFHKSWHKLMKYESSPNEISDEISF